MAADPAMLLATGALAPLAAGPLIRIGQDSLAVQIAPQAGGRIAQIIHDEAAWLVSHDEQAAMIGWGCYPMVPWAGRIRDGRFDFEGHHYQLPSNLGAHAIHGLGFAMPWQVIAHSQRHLELSLALPADHRWPFGGRCRQRLEVLSGHALRLTLSVSAGERAMPVSIGWHPWFRKPERIEFTPVSMYPRDHQDIATWPLVEPSAGPWDDCFVNNQPVVIHRGGQHLKLSSGCSHWVVYDESAHATCVEPQTAPPDAPNIAPTRLAPGATLEAWFLLEWSDRSAVGATSVAMKPYR